MSSTAPAQTAAPVLCLREVKKSYGAVQALRGIDLEVSAGEVIGLVGDNGAGKSTLIKVIGGVTPMSDGEILIDSVRQERMTAVVAQQLGIETIHQNLALIDTLDVSANIFLNRELVRKDVVGKALGWLDKPGMATQAMKALEGFALPTGVTRRAVSQLSGGQRQIVAIARALYWRPRVMMMDEPTAALSVASAQTVLKLVRSLAESGIVVIFVSHDMQHVLQVADRVAVLRHGLKVAELQARDTTHEEIVMYITGHEQRPTPGTPDER